ncbi:hypothetical protein N7539_007674 [Penicillium diatomitis]|uniref:Uncharacterized protein n=1 Tax=Penicillium diatomitis TaxID=2819901 RepID=A0A9X0BP46_9EURO|nr:uncharacterized protein N7539_007674 [Penicillium diatomitis]KAJ5477530.1 hypothetical protein N7539_007674 [Penicillium diatomitis]
MGSRVLMYEALDLSSRFQGSKSREDKRHGTFHIFTDQNNEKPTNFTNSIRASRLKKKSSQRVNSLADNGGENLAITAGDYRRKESVTEASHASPRKTSPHSHPTQRTRSEIQRKNDAPLQQVLLKTNVRGSPISAGKKHHPQSQGTRGSKRACLESTDPAQHGPRDPSSLHRRLGHKSIARSLGYSQSSPIRPESQTKWNTKVVPAPRHKVALQPSSHVTQPPVIQVDVPGRNGGKENIPPGAPRPMLTKNFDAVVPLKEYTDVAEDDRQSIRNEQAEQRSGESLIHARPSECDIAPSRVRAVSQKEDLPHRELHSKLKKTPGTVTARRPAAVLTQSLSKPLRHGIEDSLRLKTINAQPMSSLPEDENENSTGEYSTGEVVEFWRPFDGGPYPTLHNVDCSAKLLTCDIRHRVQMTNLVDIPVFTSRRKHSLAHMRPVDFSTSEETRTLTRQLRLVRDRTTMLHNVHIVFSALSSFDFSQYIPSSVSANDSVDAKCQQLTALLLTLIRAWNLAEFLDLYDLRNIFITQTCS